MFLSMILFQNTIDILRANVVIEDSPAATPPALLQSTSPPPKVPSPSSIFQLDLQKSISEHLDMAKPAALYVHHQTTRDGNFCVVIIVKSCVKKQSCC